MGTRLRDAVADTASNSACRVTFAEKTLRKLPAARAMMPEGDFRDWTEIEVRARIVAEELTQLDVGAVEEDP